MKNLTYVSFILMLFLGIGSMQAQEKKFSKKNLTEKKQNFKKEDRAKKMQKELGLTPEQVKKIDDIKAKRAADKTRLKSELQRLKNEERNEIRAVYTPEQKEKLKTLKENRKKKIKTHKRKNNMQHKKMQDRKRR